MTRLPGYLLPLAGAGLLALSACMMLQDRHAAPAVADNARSGGDTTVEDTTRDAFARSAANLPVEQLRDFTFGNKMFNTNWVVAPASVKTLDGLGPLFNRVSCSSCHFKDGRGEPPRSNEEGMQSMLVRLSVPGQDTHGGPKPHPAYGLQLNERGIPGVRGEGRAEVHYEEITGHYADGTAYSLRKPRYVFTDLAYGALGDDILFSPRVAPAVFGLGLLEAVPEADIISRADADDRDHDGISGRPNYVFDSQTQSRKIGRFGWKANTASLRSQDADALQGDIGITSAVHPGQNCMEAQTACNKAPGGGNPEISDMQLDKLEFYSRTLAVPARRDVNDPQIRQGAALFAQAQCSACHTPQLRTGEAAVPQLAHQDIQPFTDLLLHDMGEELADGRPDFEASGREWRTAPLWGIGLVETVNRHHTFLHDGRARNLEEAILWHGGEAEAARGRFMRMSAQERTALLEFLSSL